MTRSPQLGDKSLRKHEWHSLFPLG